jgi:hypothetical protein
MISDPAAGGKLSLWVEIIRSTDAGTAASPHGPRGRRAQPMMMRSQHYRVPVPFNRALHAIQSAKRKILVAMIGAAVVQFDLSPVLHGAAAHLDDANRAAFEQMPAMEFTGSLGGAGAGRATRVGDPEIRYRAGYVEFED